MIDIDADPDHDQTCMLLIRLHISQNACNLFAPNQDVIGPLEGGLETVVLPQHLYQGQSDHHGRLGSFLHGQRTSENH
jgi:hypothetical protein